MLFRSQIPFFHGIMQAPSHDTMKKWYLQGMGDANKQHAEMVKKVNQVLDERTNSGMQEHDLDTDDEAYWFLKAHKTGFQIWSLVMKFIE